MKFEETILTDELMVRNSLCCSCGNNFSIIMTKEIRNIEWIQKQKVKEAIYQTLNCKPYNEHEWYKTINKLLKKLGLEEDKTFEQCQNCQEKVNLETCDKDTFDGKIVFICPKCRHGNY